MIRPVVLCATGLMFGCSILGDAGSESPNGYEFAANSWSGAKIEEMVAAWGTPNKGYKPPDSGGEGIAGWGLWSQTGIGHNKTYRYRCETLAYFNSDGTITRIVVKHSRSCGRLYKGQFEKMTRPEKAPITS